MNKEKIFFLSFFALIFLIYGQSLWGGFVFDDRGILEHQPLLSSLANLDDAILYPYWTEDAGLYRPVTLLSYAFNIIFLGGSAMSFHLVNLLLYLGICVSIYLLIKRLFGRELLAYLCALIFLVLPIHTEVVANITGRSELLALFFSLLVLFEFTKEKINFWLAGLWMFLAIGAKETAVAVTPLVVLLILIKDGPTSLKLRGIIEKYFRSFSAMVIGAALYLFARFFVLGPEHFLGIQTSLIENPLLFADTTGRLSTALSIFWMYVSKTFWPSNLCSDYSYNQIPVLGSFLHTPVILGLVIFLLLTVAVVGFLYRRPEVSFAAAILVFSFLPVSNFFFPIGTIAGERLFFFPSLGLALLVAYFLAKLKNGKWLIVSVLVVYAALSFNRQSVWMSEEKLFLSAVECSPQSVLSLSNAGTVYYFRGQYDKAAEYLEASRTIQPIYSKGLNNLGLVYWKQGRNREAEALYHNSLKQKYPYAGAIENLVLLNLSEGDEASALRWLRIGYPNVGDSVLRNLF